MCHGMHHSKLPTESYVYEKWLQEPARATDLTPAGNSCAPSQLDMVNWVKESLQWLSSDVIVRSFVACGITTNDPDWIHCTKDGGIADAARDALFCGQLASISEYAEEADGDVEDFDDEKDNDVDEIDV